MYVPYHISCTFQLLLSNLIEKIKFFFIKTKNMEAESKNKIRTFEAVFVRKLSTYIEAGFFIMFFQTKRECILHQYFQVFMSD